MNPRFSRTSAYLVCAVFLAACGGGGGSGGGGFPLVAPLADSGGGTPPLPDSVGGTPPPPSAGKCQPFSSDSITAQCVGKDEIVYQADGFVTFVGNYTTYVNTRTGESKAEGPAPRLCAVSKSEGRWHLTTPFGNFSVAAQDEAVYTHKPASLPDNYVSMQTLTPLSDGSADALLFTYGNITSRDGSVTRMGTITRGDETFTCQLAQGSSTTDPKPEPEPEPAPRACTENSGPGTNGLEMRGPASFAIKNGVASVTPGTITFNAPAGSTSGSLRIRLVAMEGDYFGGTWSRGVYTLGTYPLNFTDGTNQLRSGQSSQIGTRSVSISNYPPRGRSYCIVAALEAYDTRNCSQDDRFCVVDWFEFKNSVSF